MWTSTRFTERFGRRYPIVQGPMGGGASTPELVAAVSGAGGLGSLGCYHLEPAEILRAAADIRRCAGSPERAISIAPPTASRTRWPGHPPRFSPTRSRTR